MTKKDKNKELIVDTSSVASFAESFAKIKTLEFIKNPKYRGPKMTKNSCADLVARTAKGDAFLYIPDLNESEKQGIYYIAKSTALELLNLYYEN